MPAIGSVDLVVTRLSCPKLSGSIRLGSEPSTGTVIALWTSAPRQVKWGVLDGAIPRAAFLAKYVLFRETSMLSYNVFLIEKKEACHPREHLLEETMRPNK